MPGFGHICGAFFSLGFIFPLEASFVSSSLHLGQALCREICDISSLVLVGQRHTNVLGMWSRGAFADNYLSSKCKKIHEAVSGFTVSFPPEGPLEI